MEDTHIKMIREELAKIKSMSQVYEHISENEFENEEALSIGAAKMNVAKEKILMSTKNISGWLQRLEKEE